MDLVYGAHLVANGGLELFLISIKGKMVESSIVQGDRYVVIVIIRVQIWDRLTWLRFGTFPVSADVYCQKDVHTES